MAESRRVALALGSGGARGYAHIGVIQVLLERGFEIVSIAGSSMGAAIGGLHAAGVLDAYTEWVSSLTQRDVIRLLDPALKAPGAIRAEKIMARMSELLHGARIEDLAIPYTAVATDLLQRREVWFQSGPVDVAIRASIALPSYITPVMLNGRLLADGGLLNPVPVAPTAGARADLTIGVVLSGDDPAGPRSTPELESAEPRHGDEGLERFRRTAAQVFDRDYIRMITHRFSNARGSAADSGDGQALEEVFGELPTGLRMFDVMQLSIDVMQRLVSDYRLAGYPADLYITIPKTSARVLDFHRAVELIALGRDLTTAALDSAGYGPVETAEPTDRGLGDGPTAISTSLQ